MLKFADKLTAGIAKRFPTDFNQDAAFDAVARMRRHSYFRTGSKQD
jgi:hypothetical protein